MKRLDGRSKLGKRPYINWDTHRVSRDRFYYLGGFEYTVRGLYWWVDLLDYNNEGTNLSLGASIMGDFKIRYTSSNNWQ